MRLLSNLFLAACLCASSLLTAQNARALWTALPTEPSLPENTVRTPRPTAVNYYSLQLADVQQALRDAPKEFTNGQRVSIELPTPNGVMRQFKVEETSVMAPELAARFPEIKTFVGSAEDGSGAQVRMGYGHKGFYAFIFDIAQNEIYSVRPIEDGIKDLYMTYRVRDLPEDPKASSAHAACGVDHESHTKWSQLTDLKTFNEHFGVSDRGGSGLVNLHKYRLAITAKGEYSQFVGGTKELILSAIVEAVNFINGLTERDLDVRFELIANTDALFYYDPTTDPFTGVLVNDWMDQNQIVLPPIIGNSNYDIGHIFSVFESGSAIGIAGGRVCNTSNKARACSSDEKPNREKFYLTAAHEMCHQMDGSHSWNNCSDDFNGQRKDDSGFEPGSGSTIMGYPGACGTNDVKSTNDPYFHFDSIDDVFKFVNSPQGACDVVSPTTNNDPVVTVLTAQNINIPVGTPFTIKGEATDPDGDAVTYCWEQEDLGSIINLGEFDAMGPLFRSYPPVTTGTRQFPRVPTSTNKTEVLPTAGRALNFRLTVRDNKLNGGGIGSAKLRVNANSLAGPFKVTFPNFSTDTWTAGAYQLVTWDVANTDKAPINCKKVNISLSYNAGTVFSTVLATDVPNTGRCCVKLPTNVSTICRVRIDAADQIFFNVSSSNFKIVAPTQPGISLCAPALVDLVCFPKNYSIQVSTAGVGGLNTPIDLSVTGLPPGATATFSPATVNPGESSTMTLNFPSNQTETSFDLNIIGTSGTVTGSVLSKMTVVSNNFSAVQLQAPANGAAGVGQAPLLTWGTSPDANTYEIQIGSNASFEGAALIGSYTTATGSYQPAGLDKGKVYFWRVRPVNECGNGPWTTAYAFGTGAESCTKYVSSDVPKAISSAGTSTTDLKLNIPNNGNASDVNVKLFKGNHQGFKQLDVRLIAPDATEAIMFNNKCTDNTSVAFTMAFDDASTIAFSCTGLNLGTNYRPQSSLNAFNGKSIKGDWIMRVVDNKAGAGGNLTAFELEVCSAVSSNPPMIVENKVLNMSSGANSLISNAFLKATDANNSAAQLTFHLLSLPPNGEIRLNGNALKLGGTFTQADLDNGNVRYFDFGSSGLQTFNFAVTDGEGGVAGDTFKFQFPTSEKEPALNLNFSVVPNPANEQVTVIFPEALDSETRINLFDASGRLIQIAQTGIGSMNVQLNVHDLPNGVYVLSVQNEKGAGVKKLVVRR